MCQSLGQLEAEDAFEARAGKHRAVFSTFQDAGCSCYTVVELRHAVAAMLAPGPWLAGHQPPGLLLTLLRSSPHGQLQCTARPLLVCAACAAVVRASSALRSKCLSRPRGSCKEVATWLCAGLLNQMDTLSLQDTHLH